MAHRPDGKTARHEFWEQLPGPPPRRYVPDKYSLLNTKMIYNYV